MSNNYRFDDLSDDQIQELWNQFYPRLRASIADRVRRIRRPVADESELALSAFHSVLRRAKAGQFPELGDQESFWRLLRTKAIRKANDLHKHLWADKRGGSHSGAFQETSDREDGAANELEGAVAKRSGSLDELEISETFNALMNQFPLISTATWSCCGSKERIRKQLLSACLPHRGQYNVCSDQFTTIGSQS